MNARFGPMLALLLVAVTGPAKSGFAAAPQSADAPTEVRPLLVGTTAPDVALTTSDGAATTLHAALGDGPAIVVFYRGGW